jgi:hypothetical protein
MAESLHLSTREIRLAWFHSLTTLRKLSHLQTIKLALTERRESFYTAYFYLCSVLDYESSSYLELSKCSEEISP